MKSSKNYDHFIFQAENLETDPNYLHVHMERTNPS